MLGYQVCVCVGCQVCGCIMIVSWYVVMCDVLGCQVCVGLSVSLIINDDFNFDPIDLYSSF